MRKQENWGKLSEFPDFADAYGQDAAEFLEETFVEWYDAKHRGPTPAFVRWANLHRREKCPFCGSPSLSNWGFTKDGFARQRCLSEGCGRTFTPLTGTIFDSFKIPPTEWMEFLLHLFEFHSITSSARDNRNAGSTGDYWLTKIFAVLRHIQDEIVLGPAVIIDEMSVREISGALIVDERGRKLRGNSRNRINIACGIDPWTNDCFAVVAGLGKLGGQRCVDAYAPHIARKSWVVHDGEKAHRALFEKLDLSGECYRSEETVGLSDRMDPLGPINDLHAYIRDFIESHPSMDRDGLQNWLNLFVFIWNGARNRYEKVARFMELAMRERVLLRYRDRMKRLLIRKCGGI